MFDMIETGKRLSKFRRNANLTQMEVAEKLGISFQAVSFWERGKTMPDLSNLVRIAEIYNVSIDEILNNERQISAIKNFIHNDEAGDLLEIISIMKPQDIIRAIENSQIKVDRFEQIISAAPYLEEEVLSKLAYANANNVESFSQICNIACYINKHTLEYLVLQNCEKVESFSQICELAFRMNVDTNSSVVLMHLDKVKSFSQICNIACFWI